jgi:acyl-CoA thioester hydrolase
MTDWKKTYPVLLQQDVIWGDMDAFGHVNNTVYFRYFEDVRIAYFDRAGVFDYKQKNNIGPILAASHCNFKLPLSYPDRLQIAARASIVSAKKINMHYIVYSEAFGAIAAEGEGLVVYYDYAADKSCAIPETIVTAIKALEP